MPSRHSARILFTSRKQLVRINSSRDPLRNQSGTSLAEENQQERIHGGHPNKEGIEMDFAATLIVSNTLMAAVIYLVVTWIWED